MTIELAGIIVSIAGIVLLAASMSGGAEATIRTAKDLTELTEVPMPVETVAVDRLKTMVSDNALGDFPSSWVTTPPAPVVVRRDGSDGPTYQEALGYGFMVYSMMRPRMVRMDDGRLVLIATAWRHKNFHEEPIILFSDDDGQSWSSPQPVPMHGSLLNLGGNKLTIFGESAIFSEDGGKTWDEPRPVLKLPDGSPTAHHGSALVEGSHLTVVSYSKAPPHGPMNWNAYSWLWSSHDAGHTWKTPIRLPAEWCTSEGSVTRAKDGALVVSLRTDPFPGYPNYNDHWRRITTARSIDGGLTWTHHQTPFRYGKVHTELLTLPKGDILMVYATRIGELDGHVYHGIEAVLSHDHGRTWDWTHKFILFRWALHESTHSPTSVILSDGRVLTVFLHPWSAPWRNLPVAPRCIGVCSAVLWSPQPGE